MAYPGELHQRAANQTFVYLKDTRDLALQLGGGDDLQVASMANRLVVPPLCDPSNVRLLSGYLTASDLIQATVRYRPRLVLLSFQLFKQVDGYVRWLDQHYRAVRLGPGATVYLLH